jgi:hypothetical protein
MGFITRPDLFPKLLDVRNTGDIEGILSSLPIISPDEYHWDYARKHIGKWRENYLHWLPVGLKRGNGGQIRLADEPIKPLAERLVNAMEAIIELERLRELLLNSTAPAPPSPRAAVMCYFGLSRLDDVERMEPEERKAMLQKIDEIRTKLFIRLLYDNKSSQFSVTIRDRGMGQEPKRMHETLLSLSESDKPEKPYLIGLFGQGGSSTFAACQYSVLLSRRAPDLLREGEDGGVGWTIVQHIHPKGRRDPYFAFLAASEDGIVPRFDAVVADKVGFEHGSQFSHIKYDFGGGGSAVTRGLYQALNHVLFNPILPYDLYAAKDKPDLMQGTSQRLARQIRQFAAAGEKDRTLDKSFADQAVVLGI